MVGLTYEEMHRHGALVSAVSSAVFSPLPARHLVSAGEKGQRPIAAQVVPVASWRQKTKDTQARINYM